MLKNHKRQKEPMPRKTKQHISLTIDAGLLEWIDAKIADFTFQSRSHAFEQAINRLKKEAMAT